LIFLNRNRSGSDPHLEWKVRFFFLGAALAMAGVALDSTLLVTLAIVVLVGGAALRLIPGRNGAAEGVDEAGDPDSRRAGSAGSPEADATGSPEADATVEERD
jgi:hypothetical protein